MSRAKRAIARIGGQVRRDRSDSVGHRVDSVAKPADHSGLLAYAIVGLRGGCFRTLPGLTAVRGGGFWLHKWGRSVANAFVSSYDLFGRRHAVAPTVALLI